MAFYYNMTIFMVMVCNKIKEILKKTRDCSADTNEWRGRKVLKVLWDESAGVVYLHARICY